MRYSKQIALGITLVLTACGTQSPAPVISGYSRMPWEPKLREVETPTAARQAAAVAVTPLSARVETPRAVSALDFSQIEPAAGPATTSRLSASTPVAAIPVAQPKMKTHVVKEGETLYRIATSSGLKVADVIAANRLVSSDIQPGDILLVPSAGDTVNAAKPVVQVASSAVVPSAQQGYSLTRSRFEKQAQPVAVAPVQPVVRTAAVATAIPQVVTEKQLARIEPAAAPASFSTQASNEITYVAHNVQSGETLYRIGLQYGVSPLDLMAANSLDRPQDLKSGMTLRVPVQGVQRVAQRQVNEQLAQAKGMVWPARGKLLNTYGNKGNGVTHTGINIQLPENTPISAAESGKVIYADAGLKSYGNLVLLRHNDGLVTAYAHNNQLLVKKNQQVQKGEVIAYSGATGQVTFPQLHFEVRRNAQAINPLSVLPK